MKGFGNTAVQVRIAAAKDNSYGSAKLSQLGNVLRTGSYRAQQVFIQPKEGMSSARRRVELLIQQRNELIPRLSIPEESTDLPSVHSTEDQMIKQA